MKIHLAKYQPDRIGGGWSFMRNFEKALGGELIPFEDADIYFIANPAQVQREDVLGAKQAGKKIVLRIDNAVRNSRNRNTGMTRMKDFAEWADLVIFQSEWARNYLTPYLKKDGIVILNGVDESLYLEQQKPLGDTILYSRFNRDETKNWEVARYWFSQYYQAHPESRLLITGQFSDELRDGNFDFYNGENFEYLGVLNERNMAKVYGASHKMLYTYFNDACSNTLIEALLSGCEIVGDEYYRTTGGASEIIERFQRTGRLALSSERMCHEYLAAMEKL